VKSCSKTPHASYVVGVEFDPEFQGVLKRMK